jgi:hypothetical protein
MVLHVLNKRRIATQGDVKMMSITSSIGDVKMMSITKD